MGCSGGATLLAALAGLVASCAAQAPVNFNCTSQPAGAFSPIALTNAANTLTVVFIPYGGTVVNVFFGGADVVLGFDDPRNYCAFSQHPYFGATIGRVANRITNGTFVLDGVTYHTPINEPAGPGTLHGGTVGFDRRVWTVASRTSSSATLTYSSPDGEMGFPGQLYSSVTFTVTDEDAWVLEYTAVADAADTVVSLTNHAYWNLNGRASDVLTHVLSMPSADSIVDVTESLLPTGKLDPVAGTAVDFTSPKPVGRDINNTVIPADGYDNAFVFSQWSAGQQPVSRVNVSSAETGINMEIITDQPSVQVYSGNFLNGSIPAKQALCPDPSTPCFYPYHGALALEAQQYPDAVNHPAFPSVVLKAGQTYHQTTAYRFSMMP
jgi:aldose 1-epimerase